MHGTVRIGATIAGEALANCVTSPDIALSMFSDLAVVRSVLHCLGLLLYIIIIKDGLVQ